MRRIMQLYVYAGLRSKEIVSVELKMAIDAQSQVTDAIRLEEKSAKGKSDDVIYISSRLAAVLADYADGMQLTGIIIMWRSGKSM